MKHSQKSQVASGGRTNDAQGLGWCNDGSNFSGTSMVQKVIKTKRSYQKKISKNLAEQVQTFTKETQCSSRNGFVLSVCALAKENICLLHKLSWFISLAKVNVIFALRQLKQSCVEVYSREVNSVRDVARTQKSIWLQERWRRQPGEHLHCGTQFSSIWTDPSRDPHLSDQCSCRWRWLRNHKGTWGQVDRQKVTGLTKNIQSCWFPS